MASFPHISIRFNRHNADADKRKASVSIMVSYSRKKIYINTGVKVYKGEWLDSKSKVRNRIDADILNKQISDMLSLVTSKTNELWSQGNFTLDNLKSSLKQNASATDEGCFAWLERKINERNIRESTRRQHKVVLEELKASGIFNSWSDFTRENIMKWDAHVRTHAKMQSTVYNYHKRLKPYIREAVALGIIDKDPYFGFKVSRGEKDTVTYLTDDERSRIESAKFTGTMENVADVFLFSCYTGLSYADIASFSKDMVIEKDGRKYIDGNRKKTGVHYFTILPDKAVAIAEKYDWVLPVISNQKTNVYLKAIATTAKIKKHLTFHMARHTFATWALHNGVQLNIVAKTLGHSSVKTTEIYAKTLEQDVVEAMAKLK